MAAFSIRSLAARLNLSHATVSQSLRGSPKVKEATRRRVVEEARSVGYQIDPITSELMARIRRSESNTFRGSIASILPEPDRSLSREQLGRRALMRESAARRAAELGFKIDFLEIDRDTESWRKLPGVLDARGVVGLLIFPSDKSETADRARFAGAKYPTVQIDATEEGAEHVDVLAPDYRLAAGLVRRRLAALGYHRPGLLLTGPPGSVRDRRWAECYAAPGPAGGEGKEPPPPPWWTGSPGSSPMEALRWAKRHEIDVVITPDESLPELGLPLCSLDMSRHADIAMGLDLRWAEIASRAADLIARKHFDQLCGRTESPALLSLPPLWRMPGKTDDERQTSRGVPAWEDAEAWGTGVATVR